MAASSVNGKRKREEQSQDDARLQHASKLSSSPETPSASSLATYPAGRLVPERVTVPGFRCAFCLDGNLLVQNSAYFRAIFKDYQTGDDTKIRLKGLDDSTFRLYVFTLNDAADLASFATSLVTSGPCRMPVKDEGQMSWEVIYRLCDLWMLAYRLGDRNAMNRAMDAIIHKDGTTFTDASNTFYKDTIKSVVGGLDAVHDAALYRWMLDRVVADTGIADLPEIARLVTPRFNALWLQRLMRKLAACDHVWERPTESSLYHMTEEQVKVFPDGVLPRMSELVES